MQKYSDVIRELKSSQELCAQLENRCAEKSAELDQIKTTLSENQETFDVNIISTYFHCQTYVMNTTRE